MKLLDKKAAMFGLDARIALAIFGALSVISGAALYSAIQQATARAILYELSEVSKAVEQYYLDTGSYPPRSGGSPISYNSQSLVENVSSINGWDGPYLSYSINASSTDAQKPIDHPIYGGVKLFARSKNDAWGGTNGVDSNLPSACAGASEPCGLWINLSKVNCTVAERIDEELDSLVDYKNGRFRIYRSGDICNAYLLADMVSAPTS